MESNGPFSNENYATLSEEELFELSYTMHRGDQIVGLINNGAGLAFVYKQVSENVEKLRKKSELTTSPHYIEEIDRLEINIGSSFDFHRNDHNLRFYLNLNRDKIFFALEEIAYGNGCIEFYTISDNVENYSIKKLFDSEMSKFLLGLQLQKFISNSKGSQ